MSPSLRHSNIYCSHTSKMSELADLFFIAEKNSNNNTNRENAIPIVEQRYILAISSLFEKKK